MEASTVISPPMQRELEEVLSIRTSTNSHESPEVVTSTSGVPPKKNTFKAVVDDCGIGVCSRLLVGVKVLVVLLLTVVKAFKQIVFKSKVSKRVFMIVLPKCVDACCLLNMVVISFYVYIRAA